MRPSVAVSASSSESSSPESFSLLSLLLDTATLLNCKGGTDNNAPFVYQSEGWMEYGTAWGRVLSARGRVLSAWGRVVSAWGRVLSSRGRV
jgi:hypothetical protein